MRIRPFAITAIAAVVLLSSCVSYEPRPLDLTAILAELEHVSLPAPDSRPASGPVGPGDALPTLPSLTPLDAAAFAVIHAPRLAARRAEIGVANAELVEAGLLSNPTISFDAMDAIAAAAIEGRAGTVDFVGGLGLSWPLPRPGEITAKEDAALARIEETRAELRAEEWRLVQNVFAAYLELAGADERLALNARLRDIARRTAALVASARAAGGATVLQDNLTALEVARLEQLHVRLENDRAAALQLLNELMGLPPDAGWRIALDPGFWSRPAAIVEVRTLVEKAVQFRPDLKALIAAYDRAESDVRLEIARQFPSIEIGTGIALELPIATGFNEPAIRTAEARRAKLAKDVEVAVFDVRKEIFARKLVYDRFAAELDVFDRQVRPRLDESLRLLQESLRLGAATVFELVTTQQQVIDAEERALDARVGRERERIALQTIAGEWPPGFAAPETMQRTEKNAAERREVKP